VVEVEVVLLVAVTVSGSGEEVLLANVLVPTKTAL
jgi:hypothetical protein